MKQLVKDFLIAKNDEEAARQRRVRVEEAIAQAMGGLKLEGSTTKEVDNYKVVVTTKLTRTLDYEKYLALGLPKEQQFVELKPQINIAAYKVASLKNPVIALCVTTKPAKTAVRVEVRK